MRDSVRSSISPPTPMANTGCGWSSSAFCMSANVTRPERSVPSVNTTSVPKRSGVRARSTAWSSTAVARTIAPCRLVEGSRPSNPPSADTARADAPADPVNGTIG